MPTIALHNVYKTFKTKHGRKDVLRDVSLEIPNQSFTVLTGESGAGKSTLLNMIGGLELPTEGAIIIDGQDISQLSGTARTDFYRHQVGFVFQGFYLQPQLTLAENIALPGTFANLDSAACDNRTHELAQMLSITEVLARKPDAASGGQIERACIARALFMNPKIILADEPTNNLDPMNARNVVQLFQEVWQQTGATMIIASHDERLFHVANQVLHVVDAQVQDVTDQFRNTSPIDQQPLMIDPETQQPAPKNATSTTTPNSSNLAHENTPTPQA